LLVFDCQSFVKIVLQIFSTNRTVPRHPTTCQLGQKKALSGTERAGTSGSGRMWDGGEQVFH
jgi:hypothetical protein